METTAAPIQPITLASRKERAVSAGSTKLPKNNTSTHTALAAQYKDQERSFRVRNNRANTARAALRTIKMNRPPRAWIAPCQEGSGGATAPGGNPLTGSVVNTPTAVRLTPYAPINI